MAGMPANAAPPKASRHSVSTPPIKAVNQVSRPDGTNL